MQALVKYSDGAGNVRIEELAIPLPKDNEVRIKVKYAGICGTDIHIFHGHGYNFNPPVILGHEFSGIVDEVGTCADKNLVGNRVVSETYYYTCGKCYYCRAGKNNLCNQRKSIGSAVNGAFSEYIVVPEKNIHIIPDNVSFKDAALTEPLAC